MTTLDTTIRALHLIAGAIWVGGLVFLAAAVGVIRKTVPESNRVDVFRGLGRRFAVLGGLALLVLIATGTDMASDRIPTWSTFTDTEYGQTLLIKLILVAFVIVLTVVHSAVQGPAMSRLREQAVAHPDDPELQAKIRRKAISGGIVRMLTLVATLAIVVLAAKLVTG